MANAFHIQTFGDKGAQAVQLTVDHIVAIGRGRTDGNIHMAANQSVDRFLAAVIRHCLAGDVQKGEQCGDHGVAVIAGAAGSCIFHRVASGSVILQLLNVGNLAGCVAEDDKLRDTDTADGADVINGIVHINKAGSQRKQRTVAAEQRVAIVLSLQKIVHADGTGTAGMVFNDHGDTQDLVAVRGDLTGDHVRTAAQAPRLDQGDLLGGPIQFFRSRGTRLRRSTGGRGGLVGLCAASSHAHDHGQSEKQG